MEVVSALFFVTTIALIGVLWYGLRWGSPRTLPPRRPSSNFSEFSTVLMVSDVASPQSCSHGSGSVGSCDSGGGGGSF